MAYQAYNASGVANSILRDDYQDFMVSLLNDAHPLLKLLEKSDVEFQGKAAVFPVTTGDVAAVRSVGENKAQPTAGETTEAESRVLSKLTEAHIELTDEVMASAREGRIGAFQQATEFQMRRAVESTKDNVNRQLHGNILVANTNTGILTQINGAANSNTQTVDSTRFLKKGMRLRIGTAAEVADAGSGDNVVVSSIPSATSVVLTGSFQSADNDLVVLGESGSSAYTHEMSGLAHIVHDGVSWVDGTTVNQSSFQGIAIADHPEWISTVERNGGVSRPLTLALMQSVIDSVDQACSAKVDTIVMHTSLRREYLDLLLPDVRYAPKELKGGFSVLSYTGGDREIPIMVDKHANLGQIFFLTSSDIKQFVKQDWQWREEDGRVLTKVPGYNKYAAQFVTQRNLGCLRRNSHGLLRDLSYTLTSTSA